MQSHIYEIDILELRSKEIKSFHSNFPVCETTMSQLEHMVNSVW